MPIKMSHGSVGERTGRDGLKHIYDYLCATWCCNGICRFLGPAYYIHNLLIITPSFNLKCYQ